MSRIEELEKEIERLKSARVMAKTWKEQVKKLDSFTDGDKIRVFNELHSLVWEDVNHLASMGYYAKDEEHYIWEFALTATMGDSIFAIRRKLDKHG